MEEMISYVLFDPETGELLGGYIQVPPPEHVHRVPATEYERQWWPYFKLNDDRTGLVRWWFEPPDPLPEDPPVDPGPVDPEPEPPVQSDGQSDEQNTQP